MYYNISVLNDADRFGEFVSGQKLSRANKSARVLKCMEVEIMFLLQMYEVEHLNAYSFQASRGKVRAVVDFFHVRFFVGEKVYAQIPLFSFNIDMVLWYNEII